MTDNEAMAWEAFANVVMHFLGNQKSENYAEMVQKLVDTFKTLGVSMSIELHYLQSFGSVSRELW